MSDTIAFEPGGVEFNTVEVDGTLDVGITLYPALLDGAIYDLVLAFAGQGSLGVSDIFCVGPWCDIFSVRYDRDIFIVPPGRKKC